MGLTKAQKKYIKENAENLSLTHLSNDLSASQEEIRRYLKVILPDEKYKRISVFSSVTNSGVKVWLKVHWKLLFLLAVLVFASYANSLGNGFISDDLQAIRDNPEIGKISYFWGNSIFFLRAMFVFIVHKIFGLQPEFYRLVNILFHLGSVWVIYIMMSVLSKPPMPIFTASLFAVHPILVECISWISGGPYAQYAFFGLLSLLFYILSKENKKNYYFSLFFFIVTLLSTERAIVLMPIIIFWEISLGDLRKNYKKVIPFCILATAILILSVLKIGDRFTVLQTKFGLENQVRNPFIYDPVIITTYLQTLLFPKDLTLYYTRNTYSHFELAIRIIITLLYLASVIYFYFKKQRFLSFWLAFFIINLLPVLTPLPVACFIAERYVYLGSLGVLVVIAFVFTKLTKIERFKKATYIIFSLIIVILGVRVALRNIDWKDDEHLWPATLKVSPNCVNAVHNLGNVYFFKGDFDKAAELYQMAIAMKSNYADPYNNLACIYNKKNEREKAIEYYKKAVELNPYFWEAYSGLAVAYFQEKKTDLAKECLLKAAKINPVLPLLFTNLGVVYLELGEKDKAKEALGQALALNPNENNAKNLLGFLEKGINIKVANLF